MAAVGAVLLASATVRGFLARAAVTDAATTALLALGTALCLAALLGAVLLDRRGDGLVVPEGTRLPTLSWGAPLLPVALCAAVAGAYASPVFLALGALLLLAGSYGVTRQLRTGGGRRTGLGGLDGAGPDEAPDEAVPDRGVVVAARRIRGFGARHAAEGDASVRAVLEHAGRGVTRVVVVGRDGAFGDVVVTGDPARAEQAVRLAGAQLAEPTSREWGAAIRTGEYEWRRMAGLQVEGGRPGR